MGRNVRADRARARRVAAALSPAALPMPATLPVVGHLCTGGRATILDPTGLAVTGAGIDAFLRLPEREPSATDDAG